jgi:cysteine desulfuration protein SufE
MTTTQKTQQQIIGEFKGLHTWFDKYGYLIKLGKTLPAIEPKNKNDDTLIRGCQVNTWFYSEFKDGKVHYKIDSISLIIKGTAVLLLRVLDGLTPEEIRNTDLYFIDETGLRENFSPMKANSLWKLVNRMQSDAAGYEKDIK